MASIAAPSLRTSASPSEASGARMRLQATGSLRRRPTRAFTAAGVRHQARQVDGTIFGEGRGEGDGQAEAVLAHGP
jgi:hypothetical protein